MVNKIQLEIAADETKLAQVIRHNTKKRNVKDLVYENHSANTPVFTVF